MKFTRRTVMGSLAATAAGALPAFGQAFPQQAGEDRGRLCRRRRHRLRGARPGRSA